MKIAVVDHFANPGGGSRFTKIFLENLSKYNQKHEISFFGKKNFLNDENIYTYEKKNFKIFCLRSSLLDFKNIYIVNKLIKLLRVKFYKFFNFLPIILNGNTNKELKMRLKNFDLILFLWPYFLKIPSLKTRKIVIVHDLNFKYSFKKRKNFTPKNIKILNSQFKNLTRNCDIIVTSNFMKSEFLKFYPNFRNQIKIIRMGPFTKGNIIYTSKYKNILKKKYIICPSNTTHHKNLKNMLLAFLEVKRKIKDLKLVISGPNTDKLAQLFKKEISAFKKNKKDVIGLGHVENSEIDFLIKNAEIVINPSLYEPGNGSGADAWKLGSLVAMSDIKSFREQLKYLKTNAVLFDPNNCKDIAKKLINYMFLDKKTKKKYLDNSKRKIKKVNWKILINDYMNYFSN